MKSFPSHFRPDQRGSFPAHFRARTLSRLREAIYDHSLVEDYETPFRIYDFASKYNIDQKLIDELLPEVMKELEKNRWKTQVAHQGTCLYVYDGPLPKALSWCEEF